MNVSTAPGLDDTTNAGECLTDPGNLAIDKMICAMSRHHDCAAHCLVPPRVMHTFGAEFTAVAGPC